MLVPTSGAAAAAAPAGTSWALSNIAPVGTSTAWAVFGQAGALDVPFAEAIALTTNGGRSWVDRTPRGLAEATSRRMIYRVVPLNSKVAWAQVGGLESGSIQDLLATGDGGRQWASLGLLPSPYCQLQFVSHSLGWCTVSLAAMGYDPMIIYRTADGGRHWDLQSRSSTYQKVGTRSSLPPACDKMVTFSSTNEGWAAATCNDSSASSLSPLYKTDDSGRTWREITLSPLEPNPHLTEDAQPQWASAPVFQGNLGAVGLNFSDLVYVSNDGGSTWQMVQPPGAWRPWTVDVVTPTTWKLLYGRTVLTTTNAGHSWQSIQVAPSSPTTGVMWVNARDGWYNSPVSNELEHTVNGGQSWEQVELSRA